MPMPAFPSFAAAGNRNGNHKNAGAETATDENGLQAALLALETRLRDEMDKNAQASARQFAALEGRVAKLEERVAHELGSSNEEEDDDDAPTTSMEERVTALEGILKKAEEAGKRRVSARGRNGGAAAAAGATTTMARSRSRSRGLTRTLSSGKVIASNGENAATINDPTVDAAGNKVVA